MQICLILFIGITIRIIFILNKPTVKRTGNFYIKHDAVMWHYSRTSCILTLISLIHARVFVRTVFTCYLLYKYIETSLLIFLVLSRILFHCFNTFLLFLTFQKDVLKFTLKALAIFFITTQTS